MGLRRRNLGHLRLLEETTVSVPSTPALLVGSAAIAPKPIAAPEPSPRPTGEERRRMIERIAYTRAQENGFRSDPLHDWLEAERQVDAAG